MIEKKFRAWSISDKIMTKTFNLSEFSDLSYKKGNTYTCSLDIDDLIIMQFTGVKDKDGKRIYEGDILNVYNRWNGKVIFDKSSLRWDIKGKTFYLHLATTCELKIIGNIYKNPKLLM